MWCGVVSLLLEGGSRSPCKRTCRLHPRSTNRCLAGLCPRWSGVTVKWNTKMATSAIAEMWQDSILEKRKSSPQRSLCFHLFYDGSGTYIHSYFTLFLSGATKRSPGTLGQQRDNRWMSPPWYKNYTCHEGIGCTDIRTMIHFVDRIWLGGTKN